VAHALLQRFAERVGLGPRWVSSQEMVEAGIDPEAFTPAEASALKLLLAAVAVAVSLVAATALPGMLVVAPVMGWAAFVAPSVFLGRRRARRRALVLAELPDLVGLLRAFTNAQVPLEQALHLVSAQIREADQGNILAAELGQALGAYGLGETIGASLQRMADRVGVDELRTVVARIADLDPADGGAGRRLPPRVRHPGDAAPLLGGDAARLRLGAAQTRTST
jgi:Flp pilus assembly protein TadB